MAYDLDDLFALLPALHRRRDQEQGAALIGDPPMSAADYGPLKSLLSVMLREGQIVAEDIAQLYDDHFIETCAPWLIPYIGALAGVRALEDIGDDTAARAWVATTLALRKRKGTMAALEYGMRAATGWPVVAVEYWDRMATTQSLRRVRVVAGGTVDLRARAALSRRGTAFDVGPRSVELGRIDQGMGRWNLPNIGLHLYRMQSMPLGTAYPGAGNPPVGASLGHLVTPTHAGSPQYRFSAFRADQPLFQRPAVTQVDISRRMAEADLPIPITRQMLVDDAARFVGQSFDIHVTTTAGTFTVPQGVLTPANLASRPPQGGNEVWSHAARPNQLLIDPQRGRFILPTAAPYLGVMAVHVRWHFGRAFAIGGHERSAVQVPTLQSANPVTFAASTWVDAATLPGIVAGPGTLTLTRANARVELVAVENACPTVDLGGNTLIVDCADGATLLVSGLRFVNGRVSITGDDLSVRIEDCTFAAAGPVLELGAGQSVVLERSISSAILLHPDVQFTAIDSIIQADGLADTAISATGVGEVVSLLRTTVLGRVICDAVGGRGDDGGPFDVAMPAGPFAGICDSIVMAAPAPGDLSMAVTKIQAGCVRHSYVTPPARVPRRYRCLPDASGPDVRPLFTSTDLHHPAYCQLLQQTPAALLTGGENGSEMGVGNGQRNAARMANLQQTLDEYVRFGSAAGAIFETWEA
jgi:hypothetical protein